MIKAKNPLLRDLFDQLRFAPAEQKRKHLAAAEKLLLTLNPGREYPFDFIVFRLTGYRPRLETCQELIGGRELLADLQVWTRQLSGQIEEPAAQQGEEILSVSEVAKRFAVSSKTIRRWQQKGLIGRIYRFPDGKKRKGFTLSAVTQFFGAQPEAAVRGVSYKRLTGQQIQQVIDTVSEIADANPSITRRQLFLRACEKLGRHPQTIRYILNRFERNSGRRFGRVSRSVKLSGKEAVAIYRLRKQGAAINELAKNFGKSKGIIYRAITLQRARELLAKKIEFIHSPEFDGPDAANLLQAEPEKLIESGTKLLNRRQEEALFRVFNYLKFCAASLLGEARAARPRARELCAIEEYLAQAEKLRQRLIEANMPLVVSIANRHLQGGIALGELVSRGNLSLMRAVEKFDYQRGYRFSTYASWAIAKDFARYIPADAHRPDRPTGTDFADLSSQERQAFLPDIAALEQAQQNLRKIIENNLDARQRYIILNHFALDEGVIPKKPSTLKQIGEELGISKERVRQLELEALQKLRHSLSPEQFDLLTG